MKRLLSAASFAVLFCAGCSSVNSGQAIAPLLAAGGGGAGYLASKDMSDSDRALITGAGALGGLAVGSFIASDAEEAKRKEFRDGYNLARSNDIKKIYWRQQSQHIGEEGKPQLKLYAFPGNETGKDGEKLMKHDVAMPVLE